MKPSQKGLATVLSHSIRNQAMTVSDEFELDGVMNEAEAHDVSGLVYRVLKSQLDFSAYKNEIILKSLTQSRYTHQALQLIHELQQEGIQIILLKGIILKTIYPVADLRMMGDVDLLVPKSQLEQIESLLSSRGYQKSPILSEKHHTYQGPGFEIEVHWTLGNSKHQQGLLAFEEYLWHHLQPLEINQKTYWTLSDEDFLIHLILHAAGHMRSSGFGIRQLCDITLWIEKHPLLDWEYIVASLTDMHLMAFSQYLFFVCHQLLTLEVPSLLKLEKVEQSVLSQFIEWIFSNGVHGKREERQPFENYFAYNIAQVGSIWVRVRLLFPSLKSLATYYTYAHRYPLLLTIAWVHRWGRIFIRSDYTLVQKIMTFFQSSKLTKQKTSLLVALELVDEV